ncbi:MAG: hypothetical protein KDC69_00930, partial [Flavobacteriaceae bacterium]|nr:hypothetical protein [Flavobacteriaceae bacterium]
MKKVFLLIAVLTSYCSLSQTDYSDSWEDFYSYNNVKDFSKVSNSIYALADNAIFSYDETSGEIQKFSSVRGLSGETTSGIFYSESTEKLVIGYKTGLLEIVDNKGKISHNNDIERLNITGDKEIRDIAGFNNTLYLSTPFGIVVYDIDKLQFGDTYFIGNNSSVVMVNQTLVFDGKIYAATEQGIFSADVSDPNLIDFNSWTQPTGSLTGNFTHIQIFDNQLYGSKDNEIYRITGSSAQIMVTLPFNILQLKASDNFLTAATLKAAYIYNTSIAEIAVVNTTSEYDFNLQAAYAEGNTVYLGTSDFGILKCDMNDTQSMTEIHPEGPVKNDVFSITAQQNNLWVVYGGYDAAYTPRENRLGFSHFNGEHWVNRPYNSDYPARDLVHVTLDPDDPGVAYISSWNDGMLYVENDEVTTIYNDQNSSLERLVNPGYPDFYSIRINGSAFDNQGNLWIANAWVNNKLKKRAAGGS